MTVMLLMKPGSNPGSINLKSEGKVPIAALTDEPSDATFIDTVTVFLAGATPVQWEQGDSDDGDDADMICHFGTYEFALDGSITEAELTETAMEGHCFSGVDAVTIAPKAK